MDIMKSTGKWTKEKCKKEALKYKKRGEFSKNSRGAYKAATRLGCLDEVCLHMAKKDKKNLKYWTRERCEEEAKKYKTRYSFKKGSHGAYDSAYRNGWLNYICSHMEIIHGKWTKETCKREALKYFSRVEFESSAPGAYSAAQRNHWLDYVCSHMKYINKPNGYWNKERCKEEALKYSFRSDFQKMSPSAYASSRKNGWIDSICLHMKPLGNKRKRLIYVYEFSDNSCYIGLTCRLDRRKKDHKEGLVKKLKTSFESISYKILKTEYKYDEEQAKIKEELTKEQYREKGWKILNRARTGSLGGNFIKWTKGKCKEEAKKFKNRTDFRIKSGGAYNAARVNNWLEECCCHMRLKQKPAGYWTKQRCQEKATKYNTRIEFQKRESSAHSAAQKNGWLNEICNHMKYINIYNGYWTKERCKEEAMKHRTRTIFSKGCPAAYSASIRGGWLDEVCAHMPKRVKERKRKKDEEKNYKHLV